MTLHLSVTQARSLHLSAQGLLNPPQRRPATGAKPGPMGRAEVLDCIRRMALLQIDTISVVARSPYFVLWSRLGAYDPALLDALLKDGALFEYWAHEACFVQIEDYGLLRHRMLDPASMGWKYSVQWMREHQAEIRTILTHVEQHGPVRSADFERPGHRTGDGWWDWKPAKRHLETLFTTGALMVRERRSFQRVYDLRERVLPGWDDKKHLPTPEQAQTDMIRLSCRALGVVKAGWIADYYRLRRGKYDAALHALADAGELIPARIEGWQHDVFVHHTLVTLLDDSAALKPTLTTLLSPFDPVVWDRKRARELFDFDYRLECYTPAPKRLYGYFVLPILSRGRLVGRLDAKAHRKEGVFEVKALYLEPGVKPGARLVKDVTAALRRCAQWHGTPQLRVQASNLPLDPA